MHQEYNEWIEFNETDIEHTEIMKEKLQGPNLKLGDGEWNQVKPLIPKVQKWKVNELILYNNSQATILQQINHVNFSSLTSLLLNGNQIFSIEPLSSIYAPVLRVLLLGNNFIVNLNSLRKLNTNHISSLHLNNCLAVESKKLSDLSTKSLSNLNLQQHFYSHNLTHDLTWICKLQKSSLDFLWARNQSRINQKKLKKKLKKKYQGIHLYDTIIQ